MDKTEFWKHKLMAFLHDPPCKCFNIKEHERIAEDFRNEAGIKPEEYSAFAKQCDHLASAADRFPFPQRKCTSEFTGGENFPFKHPFCNQKLAFNVPMQTAELAEELFQKSSGGIPRELDWKSKFFLYWRRWPEESAKQDERLAYLPADTRIPDHTIWNHMSMTSAFQACLDVQGSMKQAFLHFQLGPVQEFIAAAKSTRDLAAGSYLLAWLTAHAMKAVSDEIGPDCIVFPSLRGQPIFDLLHKPLLEQIKLTGKNGQSETLWNRMYAEKEISRLLRPTLPNRFCALIPETKGSEIAQKAAQAIQDELKRIGELVWPRVAEGFSVHDRKEWEAFTPTEIDKRRWEQQIEQFPQTTWTVTPWNEKTKEKDSILKLRELAEKTIPTEDRDSRNYPLNSGFFWQAHLEASVADMAARRNLRNFDQLGDPSDFNQRAESKKDRLTGRDEEIGSTGYSAMSLVKRLFHEHVLRPAIGAPKRRFWVCGGIFLCNPSRRIA
jgi:CRISPR-associated protein Cmr2